MSKKSPKAVLLLEDGTTFEGLPFGAAGEAIGETVVFTGVVGYQEVITDPSYRGTLVVLTYPIIGSYGVNAEDVESSRAQVSGLIIKDYSACYSNFRATGALEDYLKAQGVVGIQGLDTRAIAVHLREHGEMKGLIASGEAVEPKRLAKKLKAARSPFASDLVNGLPTASAPQPTNPGGPKVAVVDLGVKRSLLDQLAALGCSVEILPSGSSAEEILARSPDAVIISGGPGDPRTLGCAIDLAKALLGKTRLLGIGLGHQVLALALGCQVRRMKMGHRGVNYPVRSEGERRGQITVQHHSFAVDGASLPSGVAVTHVNVNDQTIEGIRSREHEAWSVQFHPSLDEFGQPSEVLRRFVGAGPEQ